jgi:hypothetical protein
MRWSCPVVRHPSAANRPLARITFSAFIAAGGACTPAHAVDAACAALNKAVNAGMAQARIHAVVDAPLDAAALKMGMKPTLMHSIVIGKVQHSNALGRFSPVDVADPGLRQLASDLAAFAVESGCTAVGSQRVAGRNAQLFAFSTDLGRGEARVQLWIDSASGLPLRAVSDEPGFDTDFNWTKPAAGKPGPVALEMKSRPNGKRVVATHAYLYGDAVKAPDAHGAVDAAVLAQLQGLLKGGQ